MNDLSKSLTIEQVSFPAIDKAEIELSIARLDLIHPLASGNKFYKLKPNLNYARQHGYTCLLSFGGAFSNHIHAFALYAGQQGFKTIGIIRGEPQYATNPTLQDAQQAGMRLKFVNRKEYKRRHDKDYLEQLQQAYPDALIIPEGGSSQLAVSSCREIMHQINEINGFDIVAAACGTGATFAGLACGLSEKQTALAYAALRDESLAARIKGFIDNTAPTTQGNYKLVQADFGGFAKFNQDVLDFILLFLEHTGILLDPIYTGKMMFRFMQQVESGEFKKGAKVCMVHSGGLQGWRGMKDQVIKLGGKQSWAIIDKNLNLNLY